MCRLIAYLGYPVLLEDILVKPINSIVMQSLHARESNLPTNGDGFGLGWYAPEISPDPALFTSVLPAWNDRNLLNLTAKIISPCFFAHVRAAGSGGVTNYNCHPFVYKQWMLMHNGDINDFITIKRHLRHLLDDDIYHWIQGETDSEHLFALFLQLAKGKDLSNLNVVADVLQTTFYEINQLVQHFSNQDPSYYNICLTDGKRLIATRYCTVKNIMPESMHYFAGKNFERRNHHRKAETSDHKHEAVLVASERLNNFNANWQEVPPNHLLLIDEEKRIELRPL